MSIEIIGWIGAILLATCGLPQLYKTIKTKSFEGLSIVFITWWFLGEVFVLIYVLERAFRWPLIFNYGVNIVVCAIIFGLWIGFVLKYKK